MLLPSGATQGYFRSSVIYAETQGVGPFAPRSIGVRMALFSRWDPQGEDAGRPDLLGEEVLQHSDGAAILVRNPLPSSVNLGKII